MRKALLVTYTMLDPSAVGVFFRALRLARELQRRGWSCVVFNYGPIPDDPKVTNAGPRCEIHRFDSDNSTRDFEKLVSAYRRINPDAVLFGEYPMAFMEPLLVAACVLVKPPIVVIDQYYDTEAGATLPGVDYYLMYGLQSLWPAAAHKDTSRRIVPPFIERVAKKSELPVPATFARLPWITVAGFETRVLRAGIELLAELRDEDFIGITLSHDPEATERLLDAAAVPAGKRLSLPLQDDAHYFGLVAASRAAILGNGFMQMAEAVALGCPAVCVDRGIGMAADTVHPAFHRFVSLETTTAARASRVREWLDDSPFTAGQLAALRLERGGAAVTADILEAAVQERRRAPRKERRARWWRRVIRPSTLLRAPNAR